MKLNLSSDFTKNLVSSILSSVIRKKLGYDVDISLDDLDVEIVDGDAQIKTSVRAKINKQELNKIVRNVTRF